ncbi:MAG: NADH-quinone oxidoreductase subunit NuoE [Chthonomonadaceae bacterium]|nr:NADH-quinone oxidoreductase subunit NuoE [Chthonomonadaceae bacterium]
MSETIQLQNGRPKAPRAEDLELKFSEKAIAELEGLKGHYPDLKSCVLPCLWIAQREYGWLPAPAIAEVAFRLQRSYAEVEGVATFYSMYNTEHEPGKHMIEVCTCLSCHMCGAYRIVDALEEKLGVKLGETTADGMFTIHEVECLDACDRAPVLQIGDQYVGPVTPESLDSLLESLRKEEISSSVQLADSIVKVHLKNGNS